MTAVVELVMASSPDPWEQVGLRIEDGLSWIGGVCLRFEKPVGTAPGGAGAGVVAWTLLGAPSEPADIDGLPTRYVEDASPESWDHPLGAVSFDHVVVMTSSLDRTCGAIEATTGNPLKRVRDAGSIRQGFHRLGSMIVEVVETAQVTAPPAAFWGFVLIVDDIHEAVGRLGPEVISAPKAAVQPGRFIASFRPSAALGAPIALMSR